MSDELRNSPAAHGANVGAGVGAGVFAQFVLVPVASSPASLTVPRAQSVQTLVSTCWFTVQIIVSQAVSSPGRLSPSFVVPGSHAVQTLSLMYSSAPQSIVVVVVVADVVVELVHTPHKSGHIKRTLSCNAGNSEKLQYLCNAASVSPQRSSS